VDKVAMADQQYRMLALRMYTTTGVARELKMATDALGQPLENIAWDPELARRFQQLVKDQRTMTTELGAGFEKQMVGVRDFRFEISRLEVEIKYLTMYLVRDFAKIFGISADQLLDKFKNLNNWLIANLPWIGDWLETKLKPIMQDIKAVLTDTWDLLKLAGIAFTNLIGAISGDTSIMGTTSSFEKLATAIQHAVHGMAIFTTGMIHAEEIALHLISAASFISGGNFKAGWGELKAAKDLLAVTETATTVGAIVGGTAGAIFGGPLGAVGGAYLGAEVGGATAAGYERLGIIKGQRGNLSQQALGYANYASMKLGIPADVIWSQWAHETGGFTSSLAQSKLNLAGIKIPGTNRYQSFSNLLDFANRYVQVLSGPRYRTAGAMPQSVEGMAELLKGGGYYEDTLRNYAAGMERYHAGAFETGLAPGHQVTNYTNVEVNVTHPGATAEEIGHAVRKSVEDANNKRTQRNLAEFSSPGWSY